MENENICQIIITRGTHKGLKCCDVNKRCYHEYYKCNKCEFYTFYRNSFQRHVKSCMNDSGPTHIQEKIKLDVKLRPRKTRKNDLTTLN